MEKRVFCQLNGDRKVIGVLRGYDVRETNLLLLGCSYPRSIACGIWDECTGLSYIYELRTDIGCQVFMNLVLDEAFEEKPGGEKVAAGMVVRIKYPMDSEMLLRITGHPR